MGGVERYILDLSTFIAEKNPDFHFMLLTDRCFAPIARLLQITRCQKINRLQVYRLGPNSASFLMGTLYTFFRLNSVFLNKVLTLGLYREAARIQDIRHADVFHVHGVWDLQYPTIGLWLSQRFHRPFVVSLHGDSVNAQERSMSIETPEVQNLLRGANSITTYSKEVLHFLQRSGFKDKSCLICVEQTICHFLREKQQINPLKNNLI